MSHYLLATDNGLVPLAGDEGDGPRVAILPSADIVLHRIRLAGATERARRAEARALAEALAAAPSAELHLALGPPEADGSCWMALADLAVLSEQLKRMTESGPEPDLVVPAALLLPPAGLDGHSSAAFGDLTLVRAADWAGAVEPALAAHLGATGPHAPFVPATDVPLFDLRQGGLARARPFWTERWFQWAAGALLVLALLLAAVPPVAGNLRSRFEAEALDAATVELVSRALGKPQTDAATAAAAVTAAAGPPAVAPRTAALLAALEPVAGASLSGLSLEDGRLVARLDGSAAAINAVARSLGSGQFPAVQDGDSIGLAAGGTVAATDARTRFEAARAAAPMAARRRAAAAAKPAAVLQRHLASVGLMEARPEAAGGGAKVVLPAVKAQLLLPLLGRIEADGLRITRLAVARNADPSLAVTLEVR